MNHYLQKTMLYHLIHEKSREGHSIKWISEHFGLNWRTVKRHLSLDERTFTHNLEKGRTREKVLDRYEDFVREKLKLYPETSSAQLHDWLKEHHADFPQVNRKTVFNFVQHVRDKHNIPRQSDSVRAYMYPAYEVHIDLSHFGLYFCFHERLSRQTRPDALDYS